MTSVPNHQQLSSGNKLLSLLLILILFSSCGGSKKATKSQYPNGPRPESGQKPKKKDDVVKVPVPKKADTITKPPIHQLPNNAQIPTNRAVQVALLLPFLTDGFSETAAHINPKSEIAIQFYGGLKMAMHDASYENIPIDFNVIDTKASYSETVNLQSNSAVQNADIIIGPYRKKNARLIAQMAVKKGKVMISPFAEIKANTLSGNGTVIETFASLDTYMSAIINHLIQTGNINNIVVLKRKNGADNRAVTSLEHAYQQATKGQALTPLKVMEVDQSDLAFEELDLKEMLTIKPNTIFIIPVWKSTNYVTSIVRKIYVSRDPEESPTVIGMPQWIKFKNLDFQKLNDLHTYIPSADVIIRDEKTKAFERRYYETYSTLPEKNAYKGYDVGNYLVQLIKANKAGSFSVPNSQGLFVDYKFTEEYNNPSDNLDNQPVMFKNNYVKMLQLRDYKLHE